MANEEPVMRDNRRKSVHTKILDQNSPAYKDFKSRGFLYVFNPEGENLDDLHKEMKGLGFKKKACKSKEILLSKIKSDVKNNAKYTEDYCVGVLTVTRNKLKDESEIVRNFHGDTCPKLQCKPKLFFFLTVTTRELMVPMTHDGEDEADGVFEYVLAHEADLFIYKDTSPTAVKDLCGFIKILNTANKNGFYIPDEITTYLKTIERPKLPIDSNETKIISAPKPTIHDSLTRRLFMGPKAVVNADKTKLKNKDTNRKILSAIQFIEEDMDITDLTINGIDLEEVKNRIERDRNCAIKDGKKILKELESIIENNTADDQ